MGAGSLGEGGGEEEGGGLWVPAPFIAAAGRAGVRYFPSYGGANSCNQQAPGRIQHGGRRHHPVASDRGGGNAGERRGWLPPRPEPGARAWTGLRQRLLPDWPSRPVEGGRCCAWEPGAAFHWGWESRAWPGGEGRSRRGGPAGPRGGTDGRAVRTGVRRDRARLRPRAAASKGAWGTRGALGAALGARGT